MSARKAFYIHDYGTAGDVVRLGLKAIRKRESGKAGWKAHMRLAQLAEKQYRRK